MRGRVVTAASLAVLGVAGCSSQQPASTLPPWALASGTAKVTVNDTDTGTSHAVACQSIESLTTISIGNAATGINAVVDNTRTPTARSVTINNLGGFTGSYWQDLQGRAHIGVVDQTYTIDGTASGFDTDKPGARATGTFRITVAC